MTSLTALLMYWCVRLRTNGGEIGTPGGETNRVLRYFAPEIVGAAGGKRRYRYLPPEIAGDTAAVKDISVDYRNPKQNAFSDVSDANTVMMGLNAKTEAQVTSKKNTITPKLIYVRKDSDDSDRFSLLIDLIQSSESDKGNTIIYVNDEQRRNHLVEFLLDHNLGEFSERILLTTTQNMGRGRLARTYASREGDMSWGHGPG